MTGARNRANTRQLGASWLAFSLVAAAAACGGRTVLERFDPSGGSGGAGSSMGGALGGSPTGGPTASGGVSTNANGTGGLHDHDTGGSGGSGIRGNDAGTNDAEPPSPDAGDASSPGAAEGTIVWTHSGSPSFDHASLLFTSGGGYAGTHKDVWRLDQTTGAELWTVEFMGDICHVLGTVINFDGVAGTISGLSSTDGAPLWSLTSKQPSSHLCAESGGLFFTVEPGEASDGTLYAYQANEGLVAWQVDFGAEATLEHVTAGTLWVSGSSGSRLQLTALSTRDGSTRWQAGFPATGSLGFAFDAQANVYAVDNSPGDESLARLDASDGTPAWTHRPAGNFTILLQNSTDLLAVRTGDELVALDKTTGERLWTYQANPAGRYRSWQASFAQSGDLLLVGESSTETQTLSTLIGRDGRGRWTIPAALLELQPGEFYDLIDKLVSRLDPDTGEPLWSFRDDSPGGGIGEVLGSHANEVFLNGDPSSGSWPPGPESTVIALDKADGRLLWKTAEQVKGRLVTADSERIYLWSGANAKYDLYGTTTAIRFGAQP